MSDIAEFRDDNRVPEMPGLAGRAVLRSVAAALAFVFGGAPGAAHLSRPTTIAPLWLPWIGLALGISCSSALAAGSLSELHEGFFYGGIALALLSLGVAITLTIALAAMTRMVPPPTRSEVLALPHEQHPLWPHDAHKPLTEVAPGVHVAQMPLVFHGLSMGARMTVLETDEGLMVVSPIDPGDDLFEAVRSLGEVRWIVAPNTFHHMFLEPWAEAFPEARLVAAAGLPERRPDVSFHHTLHGFRPELPWDTEQVEACVFEGHPLIKEIALLHVPSRTLVVADLVVNIGYAPETPRVLRGLLALATFAERPGPPPEYKLTLTEPHTVRAAADRVASWDFDRIVLAHGRLVERDARTIWRDAFAFVHS